MRQIYIERLLDFYTKTLGLNLRNNLVTDNIDIMYKCTNKYRYKMDYESYLDLQQFCLSTMLKVALRYDSTKGATSTYFGNVLKRRINNYFRDHYYTFKGRKVRTMSLNAEIGEGLEPIDIIPAKSLDRSLEDVIDGFEPRCQTVFLRLLQGDSKRLISKTLDVSYKAVLKDYKEGLERLRLELAA